MLDSWNYKATDCLTHRMELAALIHASVKALDGSDAVKQLVGICMRIRVSIRQRGKERKGKARPAMAEQAKQDRQADGSSTVVYMHALWLKLCGPSSRMCVCVLKRRAALRPPYYSSLV